MFNSTMKKTTILMFLTTLFLFANCEESRNYEPLRKIDGTWRITRFRYVDYQTQKDSTATPANALLTFSPCSKNDNSRPSNCKLTYQSGNVSLPFTFQVTADDRLSINGDTYTGPLQEEFRQAEQVLNGGYQILELTDKYFSITSNKDCNVTAGQPQSCRYRVEIVGTKQ